MSTAEKEKGPGNIEEKGFFEEMEFAGAIKMLHFTFQKPGQIN